MGVRDQRGLDLPKQVGKLTLTFFLELRFRTLEISLRLAPIVEGAIPSLYV